MERDSDEEEYVLLDLDDVSEHLDIPLNAPYVLSGLDTLKPMLTIGDNLKLVGEYEETIGTCIVFTEDESKLVVHEETGKCITDSNQAPKKQVKPIAGLQKILKLRLSPDVDIPYSVAKPTSPVPQNQNKGKLSSVTSQNQHVPTAHIKYAYLLYSTADRKQMQTSMSASLEQQLGIFDGEMRTCV